MLVISILLGVGIAGCAGLAGYVLGVIRGQRDLADRLLHDSDVGRAALEQLARRYNAKLEMQA